MSGSGRFVEFIVWFFVDLLFFGLGALGLKVISLGKLKISKIDPNLVAGFGAIEMVGVLIVVACSLRK
jgi:hypothetical protein